MTTPEVNEHNNDKLKRGIAALLALAFLAAIFLGCVLGLAKDPRGLLESVKTYKARKYLAGDEGDVFALTGARIASLENQLGKNLPLSDEFSHLNADFQFSLGKQTAVSGAETMIRLSNGQLYYLSQYDTLAPQAEAIARLARELDGEIPFLFSYIHPGFFEGGLALPAGYDIIDRGDELGDEVLSILRETGAPTLDSRTFFRDSGYGNDALELKTDKHWTALAALLASRIYAGEIGRLTGTALDTSRLDPERFFARSATLPYDGSYGRKIGRNATLDAVEVWLPDYPTDIERHTLDHTGAYEAVSGDFSESVLRPETLAQEESGVNTEAHMAFGLTLGYEELINHGDCADLTVLVIRDSYTCPICSYLSLVTRRVVSVDFRYDERTARNFIEQCDPDIVIVSLSRLMLETVDISDRF